MTESFSGPIIPTPATYRVEGRAAEIARSFGYRGCGPEHLFLGMLHDGSWPVSAVAGLVDAGQAEAAVLAIINSPGYTPPPPPQFPLQDGYVPPLGVRIAVELGDSYRGLEHVLLWMIRHWDSIPAQAMASLADLDAVQAALMAAKDAPPPGPPADAVVLPQGVELDSPLLEAIHEALPPGTTYGFNSDASGRTWVHAFGPGPEAGTDDTLSREVLNRALAALGRPPLPN